MATTFGNPTLTDSAFERAYTPVAGYNPAMPVARTMTAQGTYGITALMLVLVIVSGAFGWTQVTQHPGWLWILMFGALGVGLITSFRPQSAQITAPIYALLEGGFLGAISAYYNAAFNGIVIQAVLATAGVFVLMLFLYTSRIIKVTDKFIMVIASAMGAILLVYLGSWILGLFGVNISGLYTATPLGFFFSGAVAVIAALSLAVDFAFIDRASKSGAPKYMEWYGAFGLTVGLIWVYISILRFLSLLRGSQR